MERDKIGHDAFGDDDADAICELPDNKAAASVHRPAPRRTPRVEAERQPGATPPCRQRWQPS